MSDVRQTKLRLLFSKNETDVTSDLSKDLLSWNYSDHESGQADEISLVLKDETGKWQALGVRTAEKLSECIFLLELRLKVGLKLF